MQRTQIFWTGDHATPLGTVRVVAEQWETRGLASMRVFGSYALVLVRSGACRYVDALGTRRRVGVDEAILVLPELAHRYSPIGGKPWHEVFVTFDGPAFDVLHATGILRPETVLTMTTEAWRTAFLNFIFEPPEPTPVAGLRYVSRLHGLIVDLLADLGFPEDDTWLTKAKALLGENLNRPMDLDRVAQELATTPETFRKRFAQQARVAPAQYRAERRAQAASNLLLHTNMSSRQIAESLGYVDEYHFAKRFKATVGKTPREFRRNPPFDLL